MKLAQGTTYHQPLNLPINSLTSMSPLDAEPTSIVDFAEKALGWMLEDRQRELLTGPSRRVILNCTRQWGKSWMAAVALLFHAVHNPESLSIVAGPTLRQSAKGPAAPHEPGTWEIFTAAGVPFCASSSEALSS